MTTAPLLRTVFSFVGFTAGIFSAVAYGFAQESYVDFTRDIRPILSNTCFHCHGPDENARQADLRLDTKEGLFEIRDGVAVVAPGDVAGSEFVRRILSHDEGTVMPPPDSNRSITPRQRELLVEWVRQGAEWKQHWAFQRPVMPKLPPEINASWGKNDIDRFVIAKMQAAGLMPSPEAAGPVLLRRIYLDLIGLPPTIDEADNWLSKIWGPSHRGPLNETQWTRLADHLMASPHYGERWARRWLDLARYADTNGYEKDRDRSIWPYRDWVINAINEDMPFDRFTVEQLAGDMLPNATVSQRIATGFHRNTMLNEEGGIDPLEFRYNALTDRVATTGTTWLGLTLGCCQCHTHKYDPVSHHEYFQVFAFLNNADEPYLTLPDEQLDKKFQSNQQRAKQLLEGLQEKWPVEENQTIDSTIRIATADADQAVNVQPNGFITVSGSNPATAEYVVEIEVSDISIEAVRLSTKTPRGYSGPGRSGHGNFVLSEIVIEAVDSAGHSKRLPVSSAKATVEQKNYGIAKAFDGKSGTGWAIHLGKAVPRTAEAIFQLESGCLDDITPAMLRIKLSQQSGNQHTIAAFQVSLLRKRTSKQLEKLRNANLLAAFNEWKANEQRNAVRWTHLTPTEAKSNLPILTIQEDDSIFASGDTAKRDDYSITLAPSNRPIRAIRLEALPDERLPAGGPGSTYYEGTIGDFYLTEFQATASGRPFVFSSASHTYAKNRYGNNPVAAQLAIDNDIQTGWSVHNRQAERHVAVFVLKEAIPPGTSVKIDMAFGRHFASSLGRFRISCTDAVSAPLARDWSDEVAACLADPQQGYSESQERELLETFLLSANELSNAADQIRSLLKYPAATTSLVLSERPATETRPTFRHHRGEYLQPMDRVRPQLPAVLRLDDANPANRLEFARWLVSDSNPLTARVVVNRHWATFFGTGIVKTVDDFGLQGAFPSHPQLLDWLAVSFRTVDRWSIRKLHKRIVSSATYRQSTVVSSKALAIDPENRLLSHSPRFRLDAEIIRDQLLVAARILSPEIGGPPVRPPQPDGVTEAAYGKPTWKASTGSSRYRRSLYTYAKRTAPFAMFSTFDAPSGEACIARRTRSNSPLQALTLLNDVMLMDLARQAGRSLADAESGQATSVRQRVTTLFRQVLVREPTDDEMAVLELFYARQARLFSEDTTAAASFMDIKPDSSQPEKLAQQAAWASTARAIFGLDETLTRE